jgi:hypothetical protein
MFVENAQNVTQPIFFQINKLQPKIVIASAILENCPE